MIKTAIPKRRYQVGAHVASLLGEIESQDARVYRYILAFVPPGQHTPALYVCAHGKKRFVIALQDPGETEARDWVATALSGRTRDIVQTYTLRWLVEVFLEDWKLHEGGGQLAKQPDEEGSSRSLILSLRLDHALLLHPEPRTRLNHQAPAYTVGSLRQHGQGEALVDRFRQLLAAEDPAAPFAQLAQTIKTLFPRAPSTKHMSGRDLGRQEPTPALRYRAAEVCART